MKSIDRMDRPPAAEHWVRMQSPGVERTAKLVFNLLRSKITWNYNTAKNVARYHIEDQIDRLTGQGIVLRSKNRIGLPYNLQAVDGFFDYVEANPIDGLSVFSGLVEYFPVRRGLMLPIRPLAVVNSRRGLEPIFLNPWSSIGMDRYQGSLLRTVLEKSIFTLSDFRSSDCKMIFLPKSSSSSGEVKRTPTIWTRDTFPMLTDRELLDQIKVFLEAQEIAIARFKEMDDKN